MTAGRLRVSGGFLFCAALLFYLDREGIVPWALLSCLAHELGHWGAIRLLGGRVARLELTCAGAELRLSAARPLTAGKMLAAALAGPAVNLGMALACTALARSGFGGRLYLLGGLDLGLALFNLLPAGWLDGGRALRAAFALMGRDGLGRRLAAGCSAAVALSVTAAGTFLFYRGGGRNFTLLAAGLWMCAMAGRESRSDAF